MTESNNALYAAFKAKDTRFDGRFFVGISSTEIYCRPVCRAKQARPENCTYFSSAAEAEKAGYRPCLLCRPELAPGNAMVDTSSVLAHRAARLMEENCGNGHSVENLAIQLGCTDRHLRRVFMEEFHVTPVQYLQTCRLLLATNLLTDTNLSVLDVAMAAVFGSLRRRPFDNRTPYRKESKDMLFTMRYDSPIGSLFLAEKDESLVGLWMEGQKYFGGSLKEEMKEKTDSIILNQTREWLDLYFKGEKPSISELPLAPAGSEFRREVWKILCEIPYGEVTTYGEISQKVAAVRGLDKMSAQAVGGAVGHNPISIIIPCHRVVGTNGSLTGYAGGLKKKIKLLTLEGADMDKLFVPAKGTAL